MKCQYVYAPDAPSSFAGKVCGQTKDAFEHRVGDHRQSSCTTASCLYHPFSIQGVGWDAGYAAGYADGVADGRGEALRDAIANLTDLLDA